MAPRSPQELRDLIVLIRRGIDAVDGVITRFWTRIERILTAYGERRLTILDRMNIMRQIDALIGRVYGATRQAALMGELFATLVQVIDGASEGPFVRIIDRTRSLVERRQPGFWQRIRGKALIEPNDPFLRAVAAFDGPLVDRQRFLRSRKLDPNRQWITGDRYRLSDRVWRQGNSVRRAIDDRIVLGIQRGEDALTIARDLERYLNPSQQPMVVRADGQVVRREAGKRLVVGRGSTPVNMTRAPGRGGWGSYPARRLVQTEISHAFNAATHEAGKITPGAIGGKWNISAAHVKQDNCDNHARNHSPGMGPGEYAFDAFPRIPDHPFCRCYETIVTVSRDQMIADLIAKYGDA